MFLVLKLLQPALARQHTTDNYDDDDMALEQVNNIFEQKIQHTFL